MKSVFYVFMSFSIFFMFLAAILVSDRRARRYGDRLVTDTVKIAFILAIVGCLAGVMMVS